MALPELTIYTDGACSPNPGPGGWGAIVLKEGKLVRELSGYGGESTNNRMELTAAVAALESIERRHRIILFTDSQYVRNGITDWIKKWQRNNWQTADRKPVKNGDLWQALLEQISRHEVEWHWVRGHGTDQWNIRADELAVQARLDGSGATARKDSRPQGLSKEHIHLFTGVTCKHSTGIGGWAVILQWREYVRVIGGREEGKTANQLYIFAVIAGLETLKKEVPVQVHTFSGYLYDGATGWLENWRRRNWQTREGKEVSNRELWQNLSSLLGKYEVAFYREDRDEPLCPLLEAKELAREFEQEL